MFFITITDKKSKKQMVREFPTKKDANKSAEAFRSLGFKVKEG